MRLPTPLLILLAATSGAADERAEPPSQLAELLSADAEGYARALEQREFRFPADHGPHPDFRNEWWYVTGNLDGPYDRRFGYELTIFRFSLAPERPEAESAWRTNQVYIAHLAITDVEDEQFLVAQRYSRGALGLAGARSDPFSVWIDDWSISEQRQGAWRLVADNGDFAIDVALTPQKPPVLNGAAGLSQKSSDPGNASYYYSIPRLATQGTVRIEGREFAVTGMSWLDREWSTSALADNQVGWDWFALQFSDGYDLMYYGLRRTDGSRDPYSGGTLIGADGVATHLDRDDVEITVLDTWDSPEGGTYPSRWRLRSAQHGLDIEVTPVLADQELFTTVRYWEGAVDVSGARNGNPISGRGYVELTGYAE
jgi:predicted secreted hydrolase